MTAAGRLHSLNGVAMTNAIPVFLDRLAVFSSRFCSGSDRLSKAGTTTANRGRFGKAAPICSLNVFS